MESALSRTPGTVSAPSTATTPSDPNFVDYSTWSLPMLRKAYIARYRAAWFEFHNPFAPFRSYTSLLARLVCLYLLILEPALILAFVIRFWVAPTNTSIRIENVDGLFGTESSVFEVHVRLLFPKVVLVTMIASAPAIVLSHAAADVLDSEKRSESRLFRRLQRGDRLEYKWNSSFRRVLYNSRVMAGFGPAFCSVYSLTFVDSSDALGYVAMASAATPMLSSLAFKTDKLSPWYETTSSALSLSALSLVLPAANGVVVKNGFASVHTLPFAIGVLALVLGSTQFDGARVFIRSRGASGGTIRNKRYVTGGALLFAFPIISVTLIVASPSPFLGVARIASLSYAVVTFVYGCCACLLWTQKVTDDEYLIMTAS